ncbi:MAG: heparinase II/III family protein [Hyphomicrobium sp.]
MAELTLKERLRKAALTVDEPGKRSAIISAIATPLKRWTEPQTPVDHLLIVPQDLRTADPSFWTELQHGQFGLAGNIVHLRGRSPFSVEAPSTAWARELHGFGWLRNLDAANDEEARATARCLALEWSLRFGGERIGVAAEPAVAARRMISWLSHANLLLEDADPETYGAITSSLGRQLSHLWACWRDAPPGYQRLLALIALGFATLSLAGHDRQVRDVEANLVAELSWQVLSDGGHVTRNPALLVELLLDLLPLSQCFTARDRKIPERFSESLEHMLPMLHYLRLGDGRLARFNGVSCPEVAGLATVAAYDDGSLAALSEARASGYARLARGSAVVVADVGRPPALAFSTDAQAGCLSFEMSHGKELVFVNGGLPSAAAGDWVPAARATASHNTLVLAETSSSRLITHRKIEALAGVLPIRYPERVDWRLEQGDAAVLEASHDGYYRRHELIHGRRLQLSADGLRLDGRDRLDGLGGKIRLRTDLPFAIHFHLAPGARCGHGDEHNTAVITLANGERWQFGAEGAALSIEESAYFAENAGPRPTQQIVLRGVTYGETEVNWVAERLPEGNLE